MTWIATVPDADAQGSLKKIYQDAIGRVGFVAEVLRCSSLNPDALMSCMRFYQTVMFGESPLTRADREMLATVTSRANHCHY